MELQFKKPTKNDGKIIATWKYDGEYSFYNNDKTEAKYNWSLNIDEDDSEFVIYNENNELIGHCSFEYDEEDKQWVFGVQIRPDLTGQGMGTNLVKTIIDFGKKQHEFQELFLLVAKFNRRAARVYEKLGFEIIEEFMWHVNDEDREFYAMKKVF